MVRAKMREATLLGLFFCAPLGYTLLARFLHRYTDNLTVDADEELRLGEALQPIVNLLVRQRREVLAVCRCAADEECSGDGIIDFSIHLSLRALSIQSVSHSFVIIIRNLLAQLKSVDRKPVRFYPECPCVLLHQSYLLKLYSLSTLNPAYIAFYRASLDKFSL